MKPRGSAGGRIRLRDVGEDRLIAEWIAQLGTRPNVVAGPGDDCAVLAPPGADRLLLLKTDCVVERVHFSPNEKPAAVGWKAMARTLSDFAAMAGEPQFALVTLVASPGRLARWVRELYRGMERVAKRFDVAIVGGETSSTDGPVVISLSALGSVERNGWVSRSGGQAGDALFVTGRLGGSIRRKHLRFLPRLEEARWLTKNFRIHAMMDLSDGLGADLPRLAKASRVGFEVDERSIPRHRGCSIAQAINNGEDYELLFAITPQDAEKLLRKWGRKFPRLPLTRIGHLNQPSATNHQPRFHGYLHFT